MKLRRDANIVVTNVWGVKILQILVSAVQVHPPENKSLQIVFVYLSISKMGILIVRLALLNVVLVLPLILVNLVSVILIPKEISQMHVNANLISMTNHNLSKIVYLVPDYVLLVQIKRTATLVKTTHKYINLRIIAFARTLFMMMV
jgi:hypothetical protein